MSTFCILKISQKWASKLEESAKNPKNGHFSHFWSLLAVRYKCRAQKVRPSSFLYIKGRLKKVAYRQFKVWHCVTLGSEVGTLLTTILGVSGSQGPLGVFRLAQDGPRPLVHCPTLWHSSPRFNWGLYNPKSGENLGINAPKILIPGCILGFLAPRGSRGCSRWSKMVPGHCYTVPHYATDLPGCIVDFKIPNWVKIWPKSP